MAVDRRPDLAERHQVALRHRPALAVGPERDAEIGAGGINDRHRVPLAQDQPVGPRVVGSAGVQRITRYISTVTRCASDSAVVGWPLPAAVVARIASLPKSIALA